MDNVGNILKQKRLSQELSIDTISQKIKIRAHILSALEENKPIDVGGKTYERMTLLTYARALGFSEAEINKICKVESDTKHVYKREDNDELFPSCMMFNKNTLLGGLLIIVIILMTIVVVHLYRKESLTPPFKKINGVVSEQETEEIEEETLTTETKQEAAVSVPVEKETTEIIVEKQVEKKESPQTTAIDSERLTAQSKLDIEAALQDKTDYLKKILKIQTEDILPLNDDSSLLRKYVIRS